MPQPETKSATVEKETDDAALIEKFSELVKFPKYAQKWVDRFEDDRTYVNEECMLIDEQDTVATNYILRNQYVVGSQINFRNPSVAVQPDEMLYGTDPMTGKDLTAPKEILDFSRTMQILLQKQIRYMNFKRVMNGSIQDAMTVGIAYLKLCVQEDFMRDPIGRVRQDDQLDNIARLKMLQAQYAEEGTDDTECAEYREMMDLTEIARGYLIGEMNEEALTNPLPTMPMMQPATDPMTGQPAIDPMTRQPAMEPVLDEFGMQKMQPDMSDPRQERLAKLQTPGPLEPDLLPEVPHFVGFNLEQVLPEDSRFDQNVTRPEDIYTGRYWGNRVFMSEEAIRTKWGVDDNFFKSISTKNLKTSSRSKSSRSRGSDEDPAKRKDVEADKLGEDYAVWEFHYKETGFVYVWVAGTNTFVDKYIPEVTWRGWFPVFAVYFNRVTGRFLPISETRLVRQLQDEVNTLRTHSREARKSSYPRFICKKGLFRKGEKEKFERATPYSITEADRADDIAKGIHEIAPVKFVPQLYDAADAIREMEIMMGVPQQAAGGVGGAKFATETAIADKQMERQSDYRQGGLDDVMGDIVEALAEMDNIVLSLEQVQAWVGPGAYWPELKRRDLFKQCNISIVPGSSGKPDAKKKMEMLQTVTAVAGNFLTIPGADVQYALQELFKIAEIRDIDPKKLFPLIPPPMPPMMPGANVPGGAGNAPAPGAGPGTPPPKPEGAPPMEEARAPEKLPNSIVTKVNH